MSAAAEEDFEDEDDGVGLSTAQVIPPLHPLN